MEELREGQVAIECVDGHAALREDSAARRYIANLRREPAEYRSVVALNVAGGMSAAQAIEETDKAVAEARQREEREEYAGRPDVDKERLALHARALAIKRERGIDYVAAVDAAREEE
jgi:hypothetical protein